MQKCGMNKPLKSKTERFTVKRILEAEGTRFGVYRDGKIWEAGYITERAAQNMADLMNRSDF